jgi:hypothetical protein
MKMLEKNPLVTELPIITSTADYKTSIVVKLTIISGDHVLVSKKELVNGLACHILVSFVLTW